MRISKAMAAILVGLAGFSAARALDIKKIDGVHEIVDGGEVVGTFWNPKTGASDVKFSAEPGVKVAFLWSADHRYLAANGGSPKNGRVFLFDVGDGRNWTPVTPGDLSDEQLAPLNAVGDWTASGTEGLRWEEDDTLLMRVWSAGEENGAAKQASIWVDLKMDGAKSKVVGVSTEEPMAPAAADESAGRLDAQRLVGEHEVVGRNPDGSEYRGKVAIRAKGGLLLFQWTVGDTVTHGTGLLEDMTVGVALESGLAIYQVFPQAEGFSLIGLWKTEGAKKANEETILVGNADMLTAKIEVHPIDGEYDFRRDLPNDEPMKGSVKISGGDVVKNFAFQVEDGNFEGEGLALGEGLAVITPDGVSVYANAAGEGDRTSFSGEFVNAKGQRMAETLKPAE